MAHWAHRFCVPLTTCALGSCLSLAGCSNASNHAPQLRGDEQSEFESVQPAASQQHRGASGGTETTAPQASDSASGAKSATPRTVEETDLYRLEGDRLYYLNAYRGLMVFDVSNVDAPKLIGRSAIYGSPVEMIVRNGFASVVVADWYGTDESGQPFYGSIVRGIDASEPANMKILGEARLGGWVRDTRVVGDVLYAVTEDYGASFGGYYGPVSSGAVANGGGSQAGV